MIVGGVILAISDVLPEDGSLDIFLPFGIILGGGFIAIIPQFFRD